MLRNLLTLIVCMGFTFSGVAQSLRGKVMDNTGETLPTANVVVKNGESIVRGTSADFDGNYVVSPLDPGTYTVEVSFVGYSKQVRTDVVISPSKETYIDFELSQGKTLTTVILKDTPPIIDKEKVGVSINAETIKNTPQTSLAGLIASAPGVASSDPSRAQTVRGGRSDGTAYIVDGVRMIGSTNVPIAGTDQIQVITGGVPAEFGDLTSGLITITTKGPSSNTFGGLDIQTSNFLDAYDYTLGEFYFSTPLLWEDKEKKSNPIVGVFVSGRGSLLKDANYAPFNYKLKDASRQAFLDKPLNFTRDPEVGISSTNTLNYLREDDFEELDYLDNNNSRSFSLQTKFNVKTSETSTLKIGGTFSNSYRKVGTDGDGRFFNSSQGRTQHDDVSRVYADYKQFFVDSEDGSNSFKNAYYQLHVDYSNQNQRSGGDGMGGDYWKYGHVGTFTPTYSKNGVQDFERGFQSQEQVTFYNNLTGEDETVTISRNSTTGSNNYAYDFNYDISNYGFDASKFNSDRAIYTNAYFDYATDAEKATLRAISTGGGLLNGSNPGNIYSLWDAPFTAYTGGSKFNREQFRITGAAGGELKNHNIKVGFEFQQRTRRSWGISAGNLWGAARQLENLHLTQASSYRYEFDGVVNENNSLVLTAIPEFDESRVQGYAANIRNLVGVGLEDAVTTDAYQPDALTLDLFSAEEMLTNNIVGSYYGYDVYGNELTGAQPDVNDFLTDSLDNGLLRREIGAFKPIYMAGYIQDKFIVNDLVFNIGVRVDRYDANQEVLKDKYSIFNSRTVGEVDFSTLNEGNFNLPSNIGSGYAVYVDDPEDPSVVSGFRDGNAWYNAEGVRINDPSEIGGSSGRPDPYLHENANNGLNVNANYTANGFTDYTPQITIMPRISFNFPVSDEVMFYAYYNILTQRPTPSQSRLNPLYYLDMALGNQVGVGTNPDLKPQQTTDYELGFKQALSETSALELSLFYREMKDMIQVAQVTYAYPSDYTQYDNRDFGTVKGMTLNYEMRGNSNLSFNINYTLQFAEGTGSGATTSLNLINFGQPDLRTTLPLSFDSRHQFGATAIYGFGRGKGYNGPENMKKWFDGFTISLQGNANSGNPYTKQRYAETQVTSGLNSANSVDGSVNGSRLPFNYRFDLKLTKSFDVAFKKAKKEGDKVKKNPMSVYLQVNNLLNTANQLSVYGYTGNADDDGYLNSATGLTNSEGQIDTETYRLLYGYKVDSPFNLSRPRTIRLGVTLGF